MPSIAYVTQARVEGALAILMPILLIVLALPSHAQDRLSRRELPARSSLQVMKPLDSPSPQLERCDLPIPCLESNQQESFDSHKRLLEGTVVFSQTPFVQQISMPLVRLWRGHMQVTGFASFDSMENVLWGLPASGSLPARAVTGQSHIGVRVPDQEQSYGLMLTLYRSDSAARGRSLRPDRWLCRVFRRGRS